MLDLDGASGDFVDAVDIIAPTKGNDFKIKTIEVDGKKIKLQIWDTAGQERYRATKTFYYKGAHGILTAFDLVNEHSFKGVKQWLDSVYKHRDLNIPKVLTGNNYFQENKDDMRLYYDLLSPHKVALFNLFFVKQGEAGREPASNSASCTSSKR